MRAPSSRRCATPIANERGYRRKARSGLALSPGWDGYPRFKQPEPPAMEIPVFSLGMTIKVMEYHIDRNEIATK
jgi:hypothetical protein